MNRAPWALILLLILAQGGASLAYEASTTHPGMTAEAMLGSRIHSFLRRDMGLNLGLFTRLALNRTTLDRRNLRELQRNFMRLDPAGGFKPDEKDAQRAVGWVMLGSVLADMPSSAERNHFYCPPLRLGLDNSDLLLGSLMSIISTIEGGDTLRQFLTGSAFDLTGMSSLEWVRSKENPGSAFYDHLIAAIREPSPAVRAHNLAQTMLDLGGLLHLLQDMASPTHVRNDFAIGHLEKLGQSAFDRGSAYERYVATAYGQFAFSARQERPILRQKLLDFFSSERWDGLADLTSTHHFSPGTLPPTIDVLPNSDARELGERLASRLPLAKPQLGAINLACARRRTCYMTDKRAPQLAYKVNKRNQLQFFLDTHCFAASARKLVPLAIRYSMGLIDFLLRAELSLEQNGEVFALNLTHADLASGHATLLAEDREGKRSPLMKLPLSLPSNRESNLSTFRVKASAHIAKLIILLEGTDAQGERVVATTQRSLGTPSLEMSGPTLTTFPNPKMRSDEAPARRTLEKKLQPPKQ